MKKLLIGAFVVATAGTLGVIGYIHSFDESQAKNLLAQAELAGQEKNVMALMYNNGCQYCHTPNATLPFYADFPVIGEKIHQDIQRGNRVFALNNLLAGMKDARQLSEVDLAKLERVLENNEMPTSEFKKLHWGSGLTDAERKMVIDWIHQKRQQFLPQNTQGADASRLVQPIPSMLAVDAHKVALGKILYHDGRLSGDGTISCHTCHQLDKGGVDRLPVSVGIHGQKGGINAPTVYNAVFNHAQFWDGRAKDLADQAGGPPFNPIEMGSKDWAEIIAKLAQDEAFKQAFLTAYPAMTGENITHAIAEFEKTLITPNSPFDRYLAGDDNALTPEAKGGYALFVENKCDTCHVGVALGGQSYEFMGIYDDYFANRNAPLTDADQGRFAHTQNPADKHKFKVPTLRNVALTAPYFHDAQAKTLAEAIQLMAHYQSGKDLSPKEVAEMEAFLESLTGELNGKSLK